MKRIFVWGGFMKKHILCYSSRASLCWDCFTNTIYYASDSLVWHRCWFGVDVSSLGLLTSLPLLTFAIFSPFAIQFAKKLGIGPSFPSFDSNDDRICHSGLSTSPSLYLGTILIELASPPQCVASKPDSGEQTPPTRHSWPLCTSLLWGCPQRSPLLSRFRSPKPLLGKVWSTSWQPCVLLLWSSGF